ncbi:conserved hypothetical protein [Ricinus communis]|uniref:Uncharacterized protein n=1 Tax=Ricinus communis TaxID=3988 RepID=B9SKG3_RICCO|nr:conserved hypothetical protein [Ricinus communis]
MTSIIVTPVLCNQLPRIMRFDNRVVVVVVRSGARVEVTGAHGQWLWGRETRTYEEEPACCCVRGRSHIPIWLFLLVLIVGSASTQLQVRF